MVLLPTYLSRRESAVSLRIHNMTCLNTSVQPHHKDFRGVVNEAAGPGWAVSQQWFMHPERLLFMSKLVAWCCT